MNKMKFVEIPVTLRLKENVAEVARMLAICYYYQQDQDDNTDNDDDDDNNKTLTNVFDNFISAEVSKIIFSLGVNLPEPPYFPNSFKQYVQNLLLKEGREENEDVN